MIMAQVKKVYKPKKLLADELALCQRKLYMTVRYYNLVCEAANQSNYVVLPEEGKQLQIGLIQVASDVMQSAKEEYDDLVSHYSEVAKRLDRIRLKGKKINV